MNSIDKQTTIIEDKNNKSGEEIKNTYKDRIEKIISLDDTVSIIYSLIESELINEDKEAFYDLISLSTGLDEYNQMQILYYLIENGVYFASVYSQILNIDTSEINIEYFLEGLKNGGDNLLTSEYFEDFINLYNNKNELLKLMGTEGFLEQYEYYVEQIPELGKIKKEKTKEAIENFEYLFDYGDTLDKLNKYGLYDWNLIAEKIFEDPIYAIKLLEDVFTLNKKEIQDLRNYKVDFLNLEFIEDIEELIEDIELYNFKQIKSLSFNKNDDIKTNSKIFLNELLKITIQKNKGNEFHILFTDITGKINNIELTSNIDKLKDNTDIYYENNIDFYNKAADLVKNYINFLDKNEFDFKIFVFKSNGKKDPNNGSENNIDYEEKILKIA